MVCYRDTCIYISWAQPFALLILGLQNRPLIIAEQSVQYVLHAKDKGRGRQVSQLPDEVLPVVLLCSELHPQPCRLILGQLVHGIQLHSNLLGARQLLTHSKLQPDRDTRHTHHVG